MSNKKLIIAFVIVAIIVITLFVVILRAVGGGSDSSSNKKPYVDKEYNKRVEEVESGKITAEYDSTKKNKDYYNLGQEGRKIVDERINIVLDLINNKKVDKIYSLLELSYKNAMFPSKDDLSEYIEKMFEKNNDKYVASDFLVSSKSILITLIQENVVGSKTTVFLTNYKELPSGEVFDDAGTYFYFGEVIGVNGIRLIYNNPKINISADNYIVYNDGLSILLIIKNKTNKEVKIDFDKTRLAESLGGSYNSYSKMTTTRYVTVPAKSTVKYEMGFSNIVHTPSFIDANMLIDDERVETDIKIDSGILEGDD